MDQQTVQWILGSGITILAVAFGYLAGRIGKVEDRMNARADAVAKELSDLKGYLSDNYVRGHEIAEVKRLVEAMRQDMATAVKDLRAEVQHQVSELTKAVLATIGNK
jgi:uncharacterized protein YoxC